MAPWARVNTFPSRARSETLTFVLCIENNAIRAQALLLCESIRHFCGRYRRSPILAVSPRPGLGVDRETRRALASMAVEYCEEPLNLTCPEYGPANRVFAGAWAEARVDSEWIAVLDSDTVFLDELDLPAGADSAARPVDEKGSTTEGPDDPQNEYWARLARLGGTSLECLPFVRTTVDNRPIRVSYNGGLVVVRRDKGILRRCAELFAASVSVGLRPLGGTGLNLRASTGYVGVPGSEDRGSSQAAVALAIWSVPQRVHHYPDHYNVPLHLLAARPVIERRWFRAPPLHVHYHWMFSSPNEGLALTTLCTLRVSPERIEWLAARLPLR